MRSCCLWVIFCWFFTFHFNVYVLGCWVNFLQTLLNRIAALVLSSVCLAVLELLITLLVAHELF